MRGHRERERKTTEGEGDEAGQSGKGERRCRNDEEQRVLERNYRRWDEILRKKEKVQERREKQR